MKWFKKSPARSGPARRSAHAPAPEGAPAARRTDWRSWDPVADTYEQVVAPHTAAVGELVLDALALEAGVRVLDVGCGTGASLPAITARGAFAVGCEPSVAMARAGRASRPDARLLGADTINLPFRDGSFDAVTSTLALEYAPKIETALFDIKRVLRSGGVLGLAAWEHDVDDLTRTWLALVEQTVGVEMFRHAVLDAEPSAAVLGHRARLETTLRDAGFRPVTVVRRSVRLEMSLEDYLTEKHIHPLGRFVRQMLRDRWDGFVERERDAYAAKFGRHVVDMRDVLIATATKP